MRKNVLFIARFDNVLKGTNVILSKTFNMQMCPPTPEMLEKTLKVMEIDLVLFYISGLTGVQIDSLCVKLIQENLPVPIVVFGSAPECDDFRSKHWDVKVRNYLVRPIAPPKVVDALTAILDKETPAPRAPKPAPEPVPEPVPAAAPKMSIADLAESLATDEPRCVLVVDDNGGILRAMKVLLEKDYRVNLANSARSALESIQRDRPDAVLLDYEMPGISGKQVLELIRNHPGMQNLPVFFLTGVTDKEKIRDVFALKPQGYFLKSSNPDVILNALDTFFKSL